MKLNFVSLLYFQRAAEMQHLTKAADSLHIAQPALSRTISGLEAELGTSLFDRTGRSIKLTGDGEILLKHANIFLEELQQLKADLKESKNRQQMTVKLYIGSATQLIPVFLMKFKQEHPEAILEILNQEPLVSSDIQADLSLFSSNATIDNDNTVTLFKENLVLLVPEKHRHSNIKQGNLIDFAGDKFIAAPKGMWLRDTTDRLCHSAGFDPTIVMESDNPNTVREFIRAGLGIAIVPQLTWYAARGSGIIPIFLSDNNCYRYLNLSWRTDSQLSLVTVLLQEYIVDNFWSFVQNTANLNQ